MTFLILLVTLAAERYLNLGAKLYRFQWFPWYSTLIYKWFGTTSWWRGYQAIAVITVPVLVLVGAVYFLIGHWFMEAKFLIALIVFIYCLGPEDLYQQVQQYLQAKADSDVAKAQLIAEQILKTPLPENSLHIDRAVLTAILVQANDRLFAVIFWFVILGPIGAVFYRMVVLLDRLIRTSESSFADLSAVSHQLRGILEWVPARLTSLGYALVGNFSDAFGYWLDSVFSGIKLNRSLLVESGRLALKIEPKTELTSEQVRAGLVLVDRTLVAYLIAVAVVTFIMWLYII